jgi:glutathionyl-hydroquinone reductase
MYVAGFLPMNRRTERTTIHPTGMLNKEEEDDDDRRYDTTSTPFLTPNTKIQTTSTAAPVNRGFNLLGTASSVVPQGLIVTLVSTIWNVIWKVLMTELAPQSKEGAYVRPTYMSSSSFRSPTNITERPVLIPPNRQNTTLSTTTTTGTVSPRYQLYVGNPCPWCHRVVLTMHLLQLGQDVQIISLVDDPRQASRGGWILKQHDDDDDRDDKDDTIVHHPGNWKDLRDVYNYYYNNNDQEYVGRCTAPLLVDTVLRTIISNESSDIVQLLIQYYHYTIDKTREAPPIESESSYIHTNLYPLELRVTIDNATDWIYEKLNNGVYRCGFATTQMAYDQACADVREGLRYANDLLSTNTFISSNTTLTVADIYLLPTLLRFDGVYSPLFKAGGTHVCLRSPEYSNIQRYLRHCWSTLPGLRASINLTQACASYYEQLFPLNPSQILPYPITARDLGLE